MPQLPPWLTPARPADYRAKGHALGLEAAAQRAAQMFREAQMAREDQQRQVQQAQWQAEFALHQRQREEESKAAAAKLAAQQQYAMAIQSGMDPLQAMLQFGPAMGQQASPEAAALRALNTKKPQAPTWVPGNEKTGEPGHWLEAGKVQMAPKQTDPNLFYEHLGAREDARARAAEAAEERREAARAHADAEREKLASQSREAGELRAELADLRKNGNLKNDPAKAKTKAMKDAIEADQARAKEINTRLSQLNSGSAGGLGEFTYDKNVRQIVPATRPATGPAPAPAAAPGAVPAEPAIPAPQVQPAAVQPAPQAAVPPAAVPAAPVAPGMPRRPIPMPPPMNPEEQTPDVVQAYGRGLVRPPVRIPPAVSQFLGAGAVPVPGAVPPGAMPPAMAQPAPAAAPPEPLADAVNPDTWQPAPRPKPPVDYTDPSIYTHWSGPVNAYDQGHISKTMATEILAKKYPDEPDLAKQLYGDEWKTKKVWSGPNPAGIFGGWEDAPVGDAPAYNAE